MEPIFLLQATNDLIDDPEEMTDLKSKNPETKSMMVEQMMDMLIDADDAARGAPTTSTSIA